MPPSPQQAYHEAFQRVLEQLNPAQREAVDHIEGPVLVIAGPGTGKTHILAARIGRILQETDTQAHNILCLTFTDAGVQAMRQRLLELIGPEAHRVHIYTYHSFCNSVIQDHLELFGRADLEPLSDLERVETIRELIDGLPTDHLLKGNYADLYQFEGQLQDLFQRMKAEGWSAGQVLGQIDRYLDSLPERPEYVYQINRAPHRKGDLKLAKIDAERERMEKLRAAAPLYDDYQGLLRRRGRYDYDDMILWVLSAFRQHPNLLRAYQEQYLYFLVDEYQDTNGSQNAVLHALIDYWESPNIFIVGDDDQSIYEFQGARLKNLTDFHAQFREELRLVVLTDNYRSSQTILDASRGLISHNEIRIAEHLRELGVEKVLTARREAVARLPEKPRIVEYPNPLHEETA
ncbi:MAG: ATP-dependent helicase, partial [Saprospiraceae bacterium]|nr:ATP-dependent helicase [Saprospiraceae bacterium]